MKQGRNHQSVSRREQGVDITKVKRVEIKVGNCSKVKTKNDLLLDTVKL